MLIQHNCECEECEGSWSWAQKAYSSNTNKTATNPASNRRIQHGKHQKESIGLHYSWYRFFADPVQSDAVPAPTPPPVAAAHLQGKKSLSLILTPNGYGCDQLKPVIPVCWNWLWLAQTGSSWFKLVFTGCECQEKMVQTGYELVLPYCWNWLWLSQTGCWNWLWLAQTGLSFSLKLVLPGSNWFSLGMSREDGSNWLWTGSSLLLKLVVTSLNWLLKLAVTSSNWFFLVIETSSNWFFLIQTGFY